jgi:SAM-dependent methyltransferase
MVNKGIGDEAYYARWYGSRDWRCYSHIVSQIVQYSAPGPILDVGAGTGLLVECATLWGLDCRGIEGSDTGVTIALARNPNIRVARHFISEPFPFEASRFQTVVFNQVIEHLEPDVAKNALREAYRVLRSGGTIMIFSPSRFNAYEAKADPTHINMYSPLELRRALQAAEFGTILSVDSPILIFGESRIGRTLATIAFRVTGSNRLSDTANCIAYKGA